MTRHIGSSQGNIVREKAIDLSGGDFTDPQGFFIRSTAGGVIVYVPFGNPDSEPITKTVEASVLFNDPVIARKVLQAGTTATGIYVGYGV